MMISPRSLLNRLIEKAIHARCICHERKKEKPGKFILELNPDERAQIAKLKSNDLKSDGLQKDFID
jgi:hypothetical protein